MEVVREMSRVQCDYNDKPKLPILIIDSGEVGDSRNFLRVKSLYYNKYGINISLNLKNIKADPF